MTGSSERKELFMLVRQPDGSLVRQPVIVNSANVEVVSSGFSAGSMPGACEATTIAILVDRAVPGGASRAVALMRTKIGDAINSTRLFFE